MNYTPAKTLKENYTPAKTLKEVYHNFRIKALREEHSEFYVEELYKDKLNDMLRRIELASKETNKMLFLLSGYIGSGKTTFLNTLVREEYMTKEFKPFVINFEEYIDPSDEEVNVIDISLAILGKISSICKENKLKYSEKSYQKELDNILSETRKEEQDSFSVGLSIIDIVSLKYEKTKRKEIRKWLNTKTKDINDLINKAASQVENDNNIRFFIIFDEIEKTIHPLALRNIVRDEFIMITNLNFHKLIVIPPYIQALASINPIQKDFTSVTLELRIQKRPFKEDNVQDQDKIIEDNKDLLRRIFEKRVDKGFSFIEKDLLNYAIEKSGGLLSQFLQIISEAAFQGLVGGASKIDDNYLSKAIKGEAGKLMSMLFSSPNKMKILHHINAKNDIQNLEYNKDNEEDLIWLIQWGCIIQYNSDSPYYIVNPLISESIKKYEQRIQGKISS